MGSAAKTRLNRRRLLTACQALLGSLCLLVVASPAAAGSVEVTAESDWWFTVEADQTLVVIYGNSNRDCEEPGADPYLWLYDDSGLLVAYDDDSNLGVGQCVSAKIYMVLDAGGYRLRAGYYPQQQGLGYEGGVYELVSDVAIATTSTTTTTSTSTTTTTTSTTSTTTTTSTTSTCISSTAPTMTSV